jgi:hypothetical protein
MPVMAQHESTTSPATAHHESHGNTPAAWTAVAIITLAFVLGTVAIIVNNWPMFWISVGLVAVGAIVGKVMAMMGLGKRA